MRRLFFSFGLLLTVIYPTSSQTQQKIKVGVLNFGSTPLGKLTADKLRINFRGDPNIQLLDPDLSEAAARGVGYSGSLNMSTSEARDLGSAMDAEFYVIGDAQTLRRNSSTNPVYYESYSSVFVISARTGRLIFWDRLKAESDKTTAAEEQLDSTLKAKQTAERCLEAIRKAQLEESNQRAIEVGSPPPLIADAPDDEKIADVQGVRLPRPYRRLRPTYPETAAVADAEATVDVLVDVGADGEVSNVQITRWGGFGLDETTIATVRQLHFFPAQRNGTPIPMRVLLRYNFRKPSK